MSRIPRKTRKPNARRARVDTSAAWPFVLVSIIVLVAFQPLLKEMGRLGVWDWEHHLAEYEVARQAIVDFHALPLWNPYIAGGTVLLQHPLSMWLAPGFLLILAFGSLKGAVLLIVARTILLACGVVALCRKLSLSRLASVMVAVLISAGGAYVPHVAYGHVEWTGLAYVVWSLYCLVVALENDRPFLWIALGGALAGFAFLAGAIYPVVGFAFFLAPFLAVQARKLGVRKLGGVILLFGISSFVVAAPKLLPELQLFGPNPRTTTIGIPLILESSPPPGNALLFALDFEFLKRDFYLPPEETNFHKPMRNYTATDLLLRQRLYQHIEFSAYIGWAALLLALVGLATPHRYRASLAASLLVLLVLVLSDALKVTVGVHPWSVLHQLPVFRELRTHGRFLVLAGLPLALFAGIGMDRVGSWIRGRRGVAICVAILCVITFDQVGRSRSLLARALPKEPPAVSSPERFVTHFLPRDGSDYATVRARVGAIRGHSNLYNLPRSAIPIEAPSYRGEAYTSSMLGRVRLVELRPNRAVIEVDTPVADKVILNQNYLAGWTRVDDDAPVTALNGVVATPVPPGRHTVVLEYRLPSFWVGLGLWLIGVIAIAVGFTRFRGWSERN